MILIFINAHANNAIFFLHLWSINKAINQQKKFTISYGPAPYPTK